MFALSPGGHTHLLQHVHLVCGLSYLGLAAYVLGKRPRTALSWTCAAVLLCFCVWSSALSVSHNPAVGHDTAALFYSIGSLGWGTFASFAALFVAVLVRGRLPRSKLFYGALIVPAALYVYAQWSGRLAAHYAPRPWGWAFVWRETFWAYLSHAYYSLFMLGSLAALLRVSLSTRDVIKRRQARIVSATAAVPLVLASLTDVVLPRLGVSAVPNMAPDFTIIWAVGLVYAIVRYRILELTPAVAADRIVATMSDGLLLVAPDGRIALSNRAAGRLLGFEPRALHGLRLDELSPPGLGQALRDAVRREGRHEAPLPMREGGERQVVLAASSLRGTSGETIGTVCVITDVTDLKRQEAALRQARDELEVRVVERTQALRRANSQLEREITERKQSEARYRLLIESMQEGLWVVDREGRTTLVNPRLAQILGVPPAEMTGRPLAAFAGAKHGAVCEQTLAEIRTGATVQRDLELLGPNGRSVSAIVQGAPLYDEHERYAGAVLTVMDVSERKQLQAQLRRADRLASLGLLAAGVGHEINNPLTFIIGNLEHVKHRLPQLLRADVRAEADELDGTLDEALRGALRVRDIVKDLRSFGRDDDEQTAPVDLVRAVEAAITIAHGEIKYRARLVKDLGPVPPVRGNEGRVCHVFVNLLANAAQAIAAGSPDENEIRIRTWHEGGRVLAEVRDTGCGIPPEDVERLFDPFFTTTAPGHGSGLGLAVSHAIVTSMGGTINVTSSGRGARFMVSLPACQEAEVVIAPPPRVAEGAAGRILIIDDEPLVRRALRRLLPRSWEVEEAGSGAEARLKFEHGAAFDVVLCDLMMSGESGMDLHEWALEQAPAVARRMVFMTGGVFTPRAKELVQRCPNRVLAKPVDSARLVAVIAEVRAANGS